MKSTNAKNWLGVIFIIIGALWILDNFDLFFLGIPFGHVFFSWHTFFIIIGAVILSHNNRAFFGYVFIGIGVVGLLKHLPYLPFVSFLNFHDLWPIILIFFGVWIILNINGKRNSEKCWDKNSDKFFTKGGPENSDFWKGHVNDSMKNNFQQTGENKNFNFSSNKHTYDLDSIDEAAVFSSSKDIITSQSFKGGKASAIFGSVELNFTQAKLAPGEHTLEVNALFGSVELRVPPEWKVIVNVSSAFGGFEDKRYVNPTIEQAQDAILIIKGSVVFGGGEISY